MKSEGWEESLLKEVEGRQRRKRNIKLRLAEKSISPASEGY